MTIRHLKDKYPYISTNLELSTDRITELKEELPQLKKYVLDKIEKGGIGGACKKHLLDAIWIIIKNKLSGDISSLNDLTLDIKTNDAYIYVLYGKSDIPIYCKNDDKIKAEKLLLDLIGDKKFKDEMLPNIEQINDRLNESFDKFQEDLKELLKNINEGEELKGKCEKCSSLVKLGDC